VRKKNSLGFFPTLQIREGLWEVKEREEDVKGRSHIGDFFFLLHFTKGWSLAKSSWSWKT
jgi:hypothetical protein